MPTNRYPSLDFDLGADIDQLRDTVRGFADDEIAPLAAEIDRTDKFPRQLWPKMGALGLHGITVEEDHGGANMGYLAHVVAMEEVSRGSAAVGLSYGAHSNLCVNQLRLNGNDAQCARYLPRLVSGEHVFTEWTLKTTITEPFYGGLSRKVPVSLHGASIVRIDNGKITDWSDYYDGLTSRRTALASYFTEWVEL